MRKILCVGFDLSTDEIQGLKKRGYKVVTTEPIWPNCRDFINESKPSALVFDCSVRGSHARQCASALAETKATRDLPLFLVNVSKSDLSKTKKIAPSARVTTWKNLGNELERTI